MSCRDELSWVQPAVGKRHLLRWIMTLPKGESSRKVSAKKSKENWNLVRYQLYGYDKTIKYRDKVGLFNRQSTVSSKCQYPDHHWKANQFISVPSLLSQLLKIKIKNMWKSHSALQDGCWCRIHLLNQMHLAYAFRPVSVEEATIASALTIRHN